MAEGRVEVNGRRVLEQGTKVDPALDEVKVDGRRVPLAAPAVRTLATYKPRWMLTTWSDPRGRPTVRELVADLDVRLFPVGRLDLDAEGLLLLTNDGDLAYRLTHPRFGVRRTYLVEAGAPLAAAELASLRAGVRLEEGPVRPVEVTPLEGRWLRLALAEGRNHVVKRLLAAVGYEVHRLVRVEYGGVTLGRLRPAEKRELSSPERAALERAGLEPQASPFPGRFPVPRALTGSGARD